MSKASKRHEGPSAESLAEIPELDFRKLRRVPNPYAHRTFVNVRVLEPDVEAAFPDSDAVNQALRVLLALRQVVQAKPTPTKPRPSEQRRARERPTKKRPSRAA